MTLNEFNTLPWYDKHDLVFTHGTYLQQETVGEYQVKSCVLFDLMVKVYYHTKTTRIHRFEALHYDKVRSCLDLNPLLLTNANRTLQL